MRAEIIGVGTELLLGQIANTNARTISEALAAIGVDVLFHTAVGDNEHRIAAAISAALGRADVVIITGGLGPTHDDLTREGIARSTGRPLRRRDDLVQWIRERFDQLGRTMAEQNLRQADQPEGAVAIPNPRGTAPGIALDHQGRKIYALPGVPMELVVMLETTVLPELATAGGAVIVSRVVKVAETPESEVASRLRGLIERLDRDPTATVALLASAGEVRVRITAKDADRPRAEARLDPVEDEIRGLLGPAVFGGAGDTLEGVVAGMLRSRGLSLALAESVTGGMVASRLVSVPGTSEFLAGSYVAYSADRKVHDLGVPALTLQRHGAVSAETAVAMAEGARRRTGADLGLSTTGEAGPEPAEAPVGTIYLGMAWAGGSASRRLLVPGERETIRRWASQGALNTVRRWLAEAGPSAG